MSRTCNCTSGWFARYVAAACGSDSMATTIRTPAATAPAERPPAPENRSIPIMCSVRPAWSHSQLKNRAVRIESLVGEKRRRGERQGEFSTNEKWPMDRGEDGKFAPLRVHPRFGRKRITKENCSKWALGRLAVVVWQMEYLHKVCGTSDMRRVETRRVRAGIRQPCPKVTVRIDTFPGNRDGTLVDWLWPALRPTTIFWKCNETS